jgi:hypothetical protein
MKFRIIQYCYGWAVYDPVTNTFPSGICHSEDSAKACLQQLMEAT